MDLISSDPLYLEKRTRKEDTKNPSKLQLRTESDIIRPNVIFRANGGGVHYYAENAGNSVETNEMMTSLVPQIDSSTVIRVTPAPFTQTDVNSMFTFSSLSTSSPNYITDDESSTTAQQTIEDGDIMNALDNTVGLSDLDENTIDNDLKDSKHYSFLQSLLGYGKHPLHLYYTPIYPVNTYFYIP